MWHVLGIIGESLNFLGAVLLAFDILLRKPEHDRGRRLAELHDFAVRNRLDSLEYKRVKVISTDFVDSILDRRAAIFGMIGVVLLGIGFLFLIGYHIGEIVTPGC